MFVVVADVWAMVAVVSAVFAAVSATCSPRPMAVSLFHHSFNPLRVTSLKAESLFNVADTCCNPIVMDIND